MSRLQYKKLGRYLTHAHSHITRAVEALESCFASLFLASVASGPAGIGRENWNQSMKESISFVLAPTFPQ